MSEYHKDKFERYFKCSECGEHGFEMDWDLSKNWAERDDIEQQKSIEDAAEWGRKYHQEISPDCKGTLLGFGERLIPIE